MLFDENSQMIMRIRSQTEEGKRMRSQLERERKENMVLREFSDKNQDDLIALRSVVSIPAAVPGLELNFK